ncbi:MAG: L-2-hydroxyglutarate oxidase [Phycisphaerales bacterium]|nr:L-2-hydroxyglutarate oxidase [Phycisphaerales bacterium]
MAIVAEWDCDIAIIGGGIVGTATALALARAELGSLIVLEAEEHLAAHQTGHNSGVIHSGLYYKPGSLKARLCVEGREALYAFCAEQGIPHERCGKVVVATDAEEVAALDRLEERGRANGLQGLRRLDPAGIRELEPHVCGIDGLHVPDTGIVDYTAVTEAYARCITSAGHNVRTDARVYGHRRDGARQVLRTTAGAVRCRFIVNCGGLQCDRVAQMCGVTPGVRIVPFRGEYYELKPEQHHLVKNLVYPVPDPRFPFLGVHFTRMIHGGVEAGPNAVLAFKREGYGKLSWSLKDALATASYGGFWRLVQRHWAMGCGEMYRSWSKRAFVRALQRLMPEIRASDLTAGGAGVRAQAIEQDGSLVDDFRLVDAEGMLHVLNAPSPAATASLSIGAYIAERVSKRWHGQRSTAGAG